MLCDAGVLELADEVDSKSIASDGVRVRPPPPALPPEVTQGVFVLGIRAIEGKSWIFQLKYSQLSDLIFPPNRFDPYFDP